MKSVAMKLGLSAEASEEAILEEVTKVMNRATEAEGKVVPLQTKCQDLETQNGTLLGEQVDALLDAHGIKADDKVRNRLKPLLLPLKNRQERIDALADFGFKAGEAKGQGQAQGQQRQLRNRDTKPPTAGADTGDDKAAEQAKANKITNRAIELQKQLPNLTTASAFTMAQREVEASN